MKLITETVEDVKVVTESSENGSKKLYIEGTFLVGEAVNKNRRMYKMDTLRREVQRYNEEYIKTNRALGEMQHPDTPTINLDRVSHRIISLEEEGNTFYGKALILNTPMGNIAKSLMEGGVSLGVSSRALGSLQMTKEGYNLVNDDLRLVTAADIVADPSAPGAFVNGIMEGVEFWYDNAKDTWISKDVERLYETSRTANKYTRKQLEESALEIFNWYLAGISKNSK